MKNLYFVASPIEAVAAGIHATSATEEAIVAHLSYTGETDKLYSDVTKRILRETFPVFISLSLYFTRIAINNRKPVKAVLQQVSNISTLHSQQDLIRLLKYVDCNIYVQKDSPIIDLLPHGYDLGRIYLLDHTPSDRTNLSFLSLASQKSLSTKIKLALQKILENCPRLLPLLSTFCVQSIIRCFFPFFAKQLPVARGLSWIPSNGFTPLSFANYQYELPPLSNTNVNSGKLKQTHLLLVDHLSQFKNIASIYRELSSINMPEMYSLICKKHLHPSATILIKCHPNILQKLSNADYREYLTQIKQSLNNQGFLTAFSFSELFQDSLYSLYPAEVFFKSLHVRSVVGIYSSAMIHAQQIKGIRVISDCSFTKSIRKLRQAEATQIKLTLEMY